MTRLTCGGIGRGGLIICEGNILTRLHLFPVFSPIIHTLVLTNELIVAFFLRADWGVVGYIFRIYKSASPIALNQLQTAYVSQELNFTKAGTKDIKITISSEHFNDTYEENVRLYSLGIQQYLNYVKNGTTRIFSFLIKNDWTNLSTYWNFTNPSLNNTLNLSQNESLIVVIEEDYGQGQKDISINTFNSSVLEDFEKDLFRIKHIGINSFQTLHQNSSMAIVSAFVVNNANPMNISWQLNNSEQLIRSNGNIELATSQLAIIVIASNFSSGGVYPLKFMVNSSTLGDNATGVAIS